MSSPLTGTELPSVRGPLPGPRAAALCDVLARVECPALTARRARRAEASGAPHDPIVWADTRGAVVRDVDGNVYVDTTAGFGAALLGYCDPRVVAAVQRQAARALHALGDVHPSAEKIALEERLAGITPWGDARVILGLSGSDAIEAALKTCALATKRHGVLAFEGAYHGLAHGPLAACGYAPAFRAPFAPQLNPHVAFAPYPAAGDEAACARALSAARAALARGDVGCVLVEPVLGRGGAVAPDAQALDELLAMAHARGALVVADEVLTGMRRATSELLASASWGVAPDVVCVGKALGGTLPVSACLVRADVAAAWGAPGAEAIHTSTFLGNPLGCAAALATLDALDEPATRADRERVARGLWDDVLAPVARSARSGVRALTGTGLIAGVVLEGATPRALAVMRELLLRGHVALPGPGGALVLTPSVATTDAQLAHLAGALEDALGAVPS